MRDALIYAYDCLTGLLAEYVEALKVATELDIIIKCKTAGDYSLPSSADSVIPVSGFTKAWRMYRCQKTAFHDICLPEKQW